MPQSHLPWCLADESKSGDVAGGRPSTITCEKSPGHLSCGHAASENEGAPARQFPRSIGKESAGNLPGICRPTPHALLMPCRCPCGCFFPEGHQLIFHRASTGHLQDIWEWPALSPRPILAKTLIGWAPDPQSAQM